MIKKTTPFFIFAYRQKFAGKLLKKIYKNDESFGQISQKLTFHKFITNKKGKTRQQHAKT
jgi:hypothetical protein